MKKLILAAFMLSTVSFSFANVNAKPSVSYSKSGGEDGHHFSPARFRNRLC